MAGELKVSLSCVDRWDLDMKSIISAALGYWLLWTSCHNVVKTSVWCSLLFRLRWNTSLPVSSATSDLSPAVYCQQCHPASPINHHLTLKHRETHGCVVSTAAKAPGHQYPQCWLNIHCIGPVSYKNTTLMLDNIRKSNYILKKQEDRVINIHMASMLILQHPWQIMKFILEGYFFNRALLAWIIIPSEWKKCD